MRRRRKLLGLAALPLLGVLGFVGADYGRGAAFVIQAAGMQGAARAVAEWTTSDLAEFDTQIPWRGGALKGRRGSGPSVAQAAA